MKFKIWEIALITALMVTLLSGFVIKNEQDELSEKLIRIHVVANSDSESDQNLKLQVRDAALDKLNGILENVNDKAEAEKAIKENLPLIENACRDEIKRAGFAYDVSAKLTVENFPTREYDTFSLPAGEYTSLRIIIGDGAGKNWWCVVYPTLCTAAAFSESAQAVNLTAEEVSLITEETRGYAVKFKIMEIFGQFENMIRR